MAEEPLYPPHLLLKVAREADLETIEAAHARLYKAARQAPEAEARRQALNQALAVLRDAEQREEAEARGYHLPLEPHRAPPGLAEAAAALLPLSPPDGHDPRLVGSRAALDLAAAWIAGEPAVEPPSERRLLRLLAARRALESLDPWENQP